MKCVSCGAEIAENVKFCTTCGTPVVKQAPPAPVEPIVEEVPVAAPVPPVPPVPPTPVYVPPVVAPKQNVLPRENKPLSPWAYYGLQLLFSIPLVGFICLIVFSLDNGNINRRNFARSYWCSLIISLIVIIVLVILAFTVVGIDNITYMVEDLM